MLPTCYETFGNIQKYLDSGPKFCFPQHKTEKSTLCRHSLPLLIGTPNQGAAPNQNTKHFRLSL